VVLEDLRPDGVRAAHGLGDRVHESFSVILPGGTLDERIGLLVAIGGFDI
jgi:hypothetical protein